MKKIILPIILCVALALVPMAYAAAPTISVTVQTIDYLYAQAGIAQPVSKSYVANERYALLVTVSVPNYMDVANMEAVIEPYGCTHETGAVPVEPGQYIITGTVLAPAASVKVTLQDLRIGTAGTAQELWQALYGDRSISTSISLSGAAYTAPTLSGSASIPQTGSPGVCGMFFIAGAAGLLACTVIRRNKR